ILKRDNKKCTNYEACNGGFVNGFGSIRDTTLQVHHLYYVDRANPWDYPDDALVTVCSKCHRNIHENNTMTVYKDHTLSSVCQNLGDCYRCGGTGYLAEFSYYMGGICFSCMGSGQLLDSDD